jgi:hypothetical protein
MLYRKGRNKFVKACTPLAGQTLRDRNIRTGTSGQEVKGDRNFRQELLDMELRVTGTLGQELLDRKIRVTGTLGRNFSTWS